MSIREMLQIATEMKIKNSFLLDVTNMNEKEAAFITVLLKHQEIYNFFMKVQDIPMKKLYAGLLYLEARENYLKVSKK